VIYDRLGVSDEVLCLAPEDAEKIFVGKRSGLHELSQNKITELIIEKAKQGGNVVRLKVETLSFLVEAAKRRKLWLSRDRV